MHISRFNILLILLPVLFSSSLMLLGKPNDEKHIMWLKLADGLKKAKESKTPMVVDFYTGGVCQRCKNLERDTYNDKEVIKQVSEKFIPIRINLDKLTKEEENLGKKFEFDNDCLLLLLSYDEKLLADSKGGQLRFTDYLEPTLFKSKLQDALKNKIYVEK